MEVATEALLVSVGGDPYDHWVLELALGEELKTRRLSTELVFCVVEVSEVLNLGNRDVTQVSGTDG